MAKKKDLDQNAISNILGSTMVPAGGARFGNIGLLKTTGEVVKARAKAATKKKRKKKKGP